MGRKGTASGQEALGKGQAHLAEDISMKGDILVGRANMGHAHLLPLNRRQGPIQESWVSNLQNQAGALSVSITFACTAYNVMVVILACRIATAVGSLTQQGASEGCHVWVFRGREHHNI